MLGADSKLFRDDTGADAAVLGADSKLLRDDKGADATGVDAAGIPSGLERAGDRTGAEAEYSDELLNGADAILCEPEAILLSIIYR